MTARPVVTLHLPMDMADAARILGVTARCFPGAVVTSPDRVTMEIVAEVPDDEEYVDEMAELRKAALSNGQP